MKFSRYFWMKLGLLALLALFLLPNFLSHRVISSSSFESVRTAVLSQVQEDLYPLQSNQNIKRYLSIDPAMVQKIEFYRSDNALNAQELVLVQFDPETDLSAVEKALEERIDSQKQIYEGYAPEAFALADSAVLDVQGNYLLYYVGDQPAAVDQTFLNALEGNS